MFHFLQQEGGRVIYPFLTARPSLGAKEKRKDRSANKSLKDDKAEYLRQRKRLYADRARQMAAIKERIEQTRGLALVLESTGQSYLSGVALGSLLHFGLAITQAPIGSRFQSALAAVRLNAPPMGGNFAALSALTSLFEVTLFQIRGKSDIRSAMIAGLAAGGIMSIRTAPCRMSREMPSSVAVIPER
ncbi:inner membrane translocase subunit 17 [Paratrimastix pyriformis]|uniref:Inner membrane translocase subunit 17 n=1 Tax=Paratrimastix pyriformis TaxID=342808 RepID=A0ABQ8UJP1_9EUKA|nr:inner membrane translocase subunit 17 [Paratrimastix pyriformis]